MLKGERFDSRGGGEAEGNPPSSPRGRTPGASEGRRRGRLGGAGAGPPLGSSAGSPGPGLRRGPSQCAWPPAGRSGRGGGPFWRWPRAARSLPRFPETFRTFSTGAHLPFLTSPTCSWTAGRRRCRAGCPQWATLAGPPLGGGEVVAAAPAWGSPWGPCALVPSVSFPFFSWGPSVSFLFIKSKHKKIV